MDFLESGLCPPYVTVNTRVMLLTKKRAQDEVSIEEWLYFNFLFNFKVTLYFVHILIEYRIIHKIYVLWDI